MFWVGEALRISMLVLVVVLIWFQVSSYVDSLKTIDEKEKLMDMVDFTELVLMKYYMENYSYMKVFFPDVMKGYHITLSCNGTLLITGEYGKTRVTKNTDITCNEDVQGFIKQGENCIYKRNGLLILGECS